MSRYILDESCLKNVWDLGNKVLYDLCSNNFEHKKADVIIAKTLFIGRIYSASLNRIVKPEGIKTGDYFYTNTIAKLFMDSDIDNNFKMLRNIDTGSISHDAIPKILMVHKKLVDLLATVIKQKDKSFASKYLHFHFKDLFFLYDKRALKSLGRYIQRVHSRYHCLIDKKNSNAEYASLFCRCHELQGILKEHNPMIANKITPRVVDNFLIHSSDVRE